MRIIPTISGLGLLAVLVLCFQNCSGVSFQSESSGRGSNSPTGNSSDGDAFGDIAQGIIGGHFDLDTSSLLYPPSQGKTDHHVHEYDDKFGVTYADYFNLLDPKFHNIQENVAPGARFTLSVQNAQLSQGGVISINGQNLGVFDFQRKADATVYTLNGATDVKLSSLKIGFTADVLSKGGLIGTETSCVVGNDPGKLGEPRNGALTLQARDLAGGLLWESTIFWHWDNGCYK